MKASPGEKVFYALNYVVLTVISGQVGLWPVGWNLESYNLLFKGTQILPTFASLGERV